MSIIYSRLSAIRDYWMARDQNARVEVRVTDLDEILQELARTMPQARHPLTNGQLYTAYIEAANQTLRPQDERIAFAFARAIETAHGIK